METITDTPTTDNGNTLTALARVEDGTLSHDDVLGLYDRVSNAVRSAKELKDNLETAMVLWIEQHGELLLKRPDGSGIKYCIGYDKTVKCKNVAKTAEVMLEKTGGDFDAFAGLLSSGAFKHGACRTALEDAGDPATFEDLFETVVKQGLDAKPIKKLAVIDSLFVKTKAGGR